MKRTYQIRQRERTVWQRVGTTVYAGLALLALASAALAVSYFYGYIH